MAFNWKFAACKIAFFLTLFLIGFISYNYIKYCVSFAYQNVRIG